MPIAHSGYIKLALTVRLEMLNILINGSHYSYSAYYLVIMPELLSETITCVPFYSLR